MMPMLPRSTELALRIALAAVLVLTPSCATSQLWSWGLGGEDEGGRTQLEFRDPGGTTHFI